VRVVRWQRHRLCFGDASFICASVMVTRHNYFVRSRRWEDIDSSFGDAVGVDCCVVDCRLDRMVLLVLLLLL
jgi:hypothetical protein